MMKGKENQGGVGFYLGDEGNGVSSGGPESRGIREGG